MAFGHSGQLRVLFADPLRPVNLPIEWTSTPPADLRYRWVVARMAALDVEEMRELVVDAWRMVVPKGVARAYDEAHPRPGA